MRFLLIFFAFVCFAQDIIVLRHKTVPSGGGQTAPTLVSYTQGVWNTGPGSKYVTVPSYASGDLIVVVAGNAGSASGHTLNVSATGLTFNDIVNHPSASDCGVLLSTATASSGGTNVQVTVTNSGGEHYGMGVWVWRGSSGVGNSASGYTSAMTLAITPAGGAHSAFVWGLFDWGANATLQTIVPTPSNTRERSHDGTEYDVYVADLIDQSGTGSVSYGISGSGSGPFSKVGLEIKGQ